MKYLYRSTITTHMPHGEALIRSTGPARRIRTDKGIEYISESEYKKRMKK